MKTLVSLTFALLVLTSCQSLRGKASADREDSGPADFSALAGASNFLAAIAPDSETAGLFRSAGKVAESTRAITPEQEYWLGRSVGANLLQNFRVLENDAATRYVNVLGQSLADFSAKPDTFSGYRFLVLDSPQINAFAAPGGFIFVTSGLLKVCRNEAELAAVLAHEVAHVALEHGLKAVRNGRFTGALLEAGADAANITTFRDSILDVTKTLVNSGYSRTTEFEADAHAVEILKAAGYAPKALVTMLESMKKSLKQGGLDFAKTHPDPDDRIANLKTVSRSSNPSSSFTQTARFSLTLGGI
jgi:predicted Zn-dependent protease